MQSVLLLPWPRSQLEKLMPPKRRVLQPRPDSPHTPAMMIAGAVMRCCCWLEGAGAVADAASQRSLCFADAPVVVAAPAGMQLASKTAHARQGTVPMHCAGVRRVDALMRDAFIRDIIRSLMSNT